MAKRYQPELGTDTVSNLLHIAVGTPMVFTLTGYAETYSILRRRLNGGTISKNDYNLSRTALRLDVIESLLYQFLPLETHIFLSLPIIDQHNLNSTDAAILAAYLEFTHSVGIPCVLIASDHRLLRAARAEGLPALDPETVAPDDVPAFLAAL